MDFVNEPLRVNDAADLARDLAVTVTELADIVRRLPSRDLQADAENAGRDAYALLLELVESPLMAYLRGWHLANDAAEEDTRPAAAEWAGTLTLYLSVLAERLGPRGDPELLDAEAAVIAGILRRTFRDLTDLLGESISAAHLADYLDARTMTEPSPN